MKKVLLISVGFLAGIFYIIACNENGNNKGGPTPSAAQTVINAIDIAYSNVTSALSATNVQAAIDALDARLDSLESRVTLIDGASLTATLTGAWTGQTYAPLGTTDVVLTLNANGTYTCAGDTAPAFDMGSGKLATNSEVCQGPIAWDTPLHNVLRLQYTRQNTPCYTQYPITFIDATHLEIDMGSVTNSRIYAKMSK